ncbi:hypothetical protein [Paenibacillus macerans]|uniref:hypothetical protein n=1 Tax=Paenibacillus macerans TaxID=44252 RepID=UPI0020418862|nr:hypothetical protein [Paenibacillus macerans]MCM3697856.1 hypothetical protein [Paenibacillus macerans]
MEVNAGTELQPFTSRYNSEQACMSKLSRTYLLLHQIVSSPKLVYFSATCSNGIIVQSLRTASIDLPRTPRKEYFNSLGSCFRSG